MIEELKCLRSFRSDVAPPGEAQVAAAREALMSAIRSDSGGASATKRAARALRATISRWPRRRLRLAALAALACSGIVLAGLLGASSPTSPQPALAAAMNRLAHIAEDQEWSGIPGPGHYLYTESKGLTTTGTMETDAEGQSHECVVQLVKHRQIWIATDGSGAISEHDEGAKFTSTEDREQCAALGITDPSSQAKSWSNSFPAGGLRFPTNDWHSLSTEPATLLVQLRKLDGGPRNAGEDFTHIGDFMRESDTPPAIRAALYEAAALIPGVKLLGPQEDPTGRTGLAVSFPYANGQPHLELIFDQQSGALLAEEAYGPEGKLSDWTTYMPSKIVSSHPTLPGS